MFKIYGNSDKFTQWTKGQRLVMERLPVGADVLFYNESHADGPLTSNVYEIQDEEGKIIRVCDVPDAILEDATRFKACFRPVVVDSCGSLHYKYETREKYFDVKAADKPADHVPAVDFNEAYHVQPDWNQMDETKPDFVKNKTHYSYEEFVEIQPEMEFTPSAAPGGVRYVWSTSIFNETVKTIKVIFDGVEYVCSHEIYSGYNPYYGNGYRINPSLPDTGEPFVLYVAAKDTTSGQYTTIWIRTDAGAHTMSVSKLSTIVKQLDDIYLPTNLATKDDVVEALNVSCADWEQNDETAKDYIKNRTHYRYENVRECIPDTEFTASKQTYFWSTASFTGSEENLRVVFDGVAYDCDVSIGVDATGQWLVIGDGSRTSVLDAETNETFPSTDHPFGIEIKQSQPSKGRIFTTNGTHTFAVFEVLGSELKKLDPVYLPQAEAVADVTEAPTAEDFNALLASLRAAGYLAT